MQDNSFCVWIKHDGDVLIIRLKMIDGVVANYDSMPLEVNKMQGFCRILCGLASESTRTMSQCVL